MAPIDCPPLSTAEATALRADQHVHIVWIVDDESYVPPDFVITSATAELIYNPKVFIEKVPRLKHFPQGVDQPLKSKARAEYARKHCCQYDRNVNKRKTRIQSFKTRKFLRYLNYLKSR